MILVLLMFTGCGGGEEEVCHAHQGMWQLVPRNVKQVDGPTASADDLAVEQARWSEPGRIVHPRWTPRPENFRKFLKGVAGSAVTYPGLTGGGTARFASSAFQAIGVSASSRFLCDLFTASNRYPAGSRSSSLQVSIRL